MCMHLCNFTVPVPVKINSSDDVLYVDSPPWQVVYISRLYTWAHDSDIQLLVYIVCSAPLQVIWSRMTSLRLCRQSPRGVRWWLQDLFQVTRCLVYQALLTSRTAAGRRSWCCTLFFVQHPQLTVTIACSYYWLVSQGFKLYSAHGARHDRLVVHSNMC